MDIAKLFTRDSGNFDGNEGIVMDVRLLKRVFITHISIVKRIHLKCRHAFSQAFNSCTF